MTSPANLIQETLREDEHYPWRVLASCVLGQRVHRSTSSSILESLEGAGIVTAAQFLAVGKAELARIFTPLGLQNQRAQRVLWLAEDWENGKRPPEKMHGLGAHGQDAWALFVERRLPERIPLDPHLARYWRWRSGLPDREPADRSPSALEVALVALASGVVAVDEMDPPPSDRNVMTACRILRKKQRGDVADDLRSLRFPPSRAGRKTPQVGDVRLFSTMRVHGRLAYFIPATYLGSVHRERVVVRFDEEGRGNGRTVRRIVITSKE